MKRKDESEAAYMYVPVKGDMPKSVWKFLSFDAVTGETLYEDIIRGGTWKEKDVFEYSDEVNLINDARKRAYTLLCKRALSYAVDYSNQLEMFEREKDKIVGELRESSIMKQPFIMNVKHCNFDFLTDTWGGHYFYSNETGERYPRTPGTCYSGSPVDVPFRYPQRNDPDFIEIEREIVVRSSKYAQTFLSTGRVEKIEDETDERIMY